MTHVTPVERSHLAEHHRTRLDTGGGGHAVCTNTMLARAQSTGRQEISTTTRADLWTWPGTARYLVRPCRRKR